MSGNVCVVCLFLLLRRLWYHQQRRRYNKREQSVEQHPEVNSEQQPSVVEEKYKTNRLTEEECKELHKKLVAYVEKEKPYINPDLKMGDLASALDTSSHSLSYLLNQYLNQSYYDFINEYRVTQFKRW